jgi:archaellum component FlaC
MDEDTTRTETCEIADGDVVVERTVAYGEQGAIVTLDAESGGPERTRFTLVDEFPDGLPVSDVGFRPGYEPPAGDADADGVAVEGVLGPGEGLTAVYALEFSDPVAEADLGEPELLAGEGGVGTDPGRLPRGGAATSPQPTAPSEAGATVPESGTGAALPSAEGDAAGPDGRTDPTEADETDRGSIGATLGLFDGDRGPSRGGRMTDGGPDAARPAVGSGVEPGRDPAANRATGGSQKWPDASSGTGESDADGPGVADAETRDAGPDEGTVAALVAELRAGSTSEEDLAALRRMLGAPTASDDVRIEHLQARVGEFAAYAEEFRAVIDEHGDAGTFVEGLEDRIDGLRADLDAVETELSALREERERNAEAIERLDRRLEAVETLPEEFATVFEDLESD